MSDDVEQPCGELAIRALAMPADTNPRGDIFGGWLLGQMDVAAGITAWSRAQGKVATVGIEKVTFLQPVKVGDTVNIYAEVIRIGTTSLTVRVQVWVERRSELHRLVKVTEGTFTFVAIDDAGRKRPVPPS